MCRVLYSASENCRLQPATVVYKFVATQSGAWMGDERRRPGGWFNAREKAFLRSGQRVNHAVSIHRKSLFVIIVDGFKVVSNLHRPERMCL